MRTWDLHSLLVNGVNPLSRWAKRKKARPGGFEPPTYRFVVYRSIRTELRAHDGLPRDCDNDGRFRGAYRIRLSDGKPVSIEKA